MANVKKGTYGSLIIILATIATFYLALQGSDVSMKITTTSATFYVNESGTLVIAGVENVYLYNGTKKMTASLKEPLSSVKNGNIITLTKRTHYGNFTVVEETYDYDTTKTNVESFPISHKIKVIDGVGYTLQYEVSKLTYNGTSRDAKNPESFGHKMKVEWQDGASYQKISKTTTDTKLTIKYKVTAPSSSYNVRLFDPIVIDNVANFTVAQCQSINDANVFIEACPTTVTQSQWVYVNLTPKLFTGNIDFAIGVNGANAHMSQFQLYKNITIVNGSNTTSYMDFVNYNLQDITYNYDGKDSWSVGQNVPVTAAKSYIARFYLDIVTNTSGKYDIALKPSAQTFAQAIGAGNFYLLDPWWNSTNPLEFGGNVLSNYWSNITTTASNVRIQPIYPVQNTLYEVLGGENTGVGELGRYTATLSTVTYATGLIGNAYNFSATNSYTTMTAPTTGLKSSGTNLTISTWIKLSTIPSGINVASAFFGQSTGADNNWFVYSYGSSVSAGSTYRLCVGVNGVSEACSSGQGMNLTNTWYHLVMTHNSTNTNLYLNNVLFVTSDATTQVTNSSNSLYFGRTSLAMVGLQDEIKIWNYPLNSSEISAEYNSGLGRKYKQVNLQNEYPYNANLVSYYRFENNSFDENYKASAINNVIYNSTGKIGLGANFDPTNQLLNFSTNTAWDFTTANYSINMWVYTPSNIGSLGSVQIMSNGGVDDSGMGIMLRRNAAGGTGDFIDLQKANIIDQAVTFTFAGSTWYHIVIVNEFSGANAPSKVLFYINGTNIGNYTGAGVTTAYRSSIGKYKYLGSAGGFTRFNGSIDEVSIYNKTLSASEISYLYNSGAGRVYNESANMFYSKNQYNNENLISTCQELQNINLAKYANYSIINDINCAGFNFTTINPFGGNLNGNSHTIYNLTNVGGNGMLTWCNNSGSVKNLKFVNANITNTTVNGGLAVVCGKMTSFTIDKIGIENSTISGADGVGALVGAGFNYNCPVGSCKQYVNNSYAKNTKVTGNSVYVGGLIGLMGAWTYDEDSYISNSYFEGNTTTTGTDSEGGLIGFIQNGGSASTTVTNSYAITYQLSGGGTRLGGVIGYSSGTYSNLYWNTTSAVTVGVGVGGDTSTKETNAANFYNKTHAVYSTWDFNNTWQENANGLPTLRGFSHNETLYTSLLMNLSASDTNANVQISAANIPASGGIVSYDGKYIVHTFLSNGSINVPSTITNASVLVVAGGGGGWQDNGGGGGAGGLIYMNSNFTINSGNYTIVIGSGGSGSGTATNGSNSSFSTLNAMGGGGGDHVNGGSGSGSSSSTVSSGYPGQGNAGGASLAAFQFGGGGGSGTAGGNGSGTVGGSGGNGTLININGTPTYYAGGGGAGESSAHSTASGAGGLGGGGAGGWTTSTSPVAGTSGTNGLGGGGGGGSGYNGVGGSGGSGVVIIRYLNPTYTPVLTMSQNNKLLGLQYPGNVLSFVINLSGNATYSPTVSSFGITQGSYIPYYYNGTIKYSNNSNVSNANIQVINQNTYTIMGSTTSNSSGQWIISGIDASLAIICGYLPTNYNIVPGCKSNITGIMVTS